MFLTRQEDSRSLNGRNSEKWEKTEVKKIGSWEDGIKMDSR